MPFRWRSFSPTPCEFKGRALRYQAEYEERLITEKAQQLAFTRRSAPYATATVTPYAGDGDEFISPEFGNGLGSSCCSHAHHWLPPLSLRPQTSFSSSQTVTPRPNSVPNPTLTPPPASSQTGSGKSAWRARRWSRALKRITGANRWSIPRWVRSKRTRTPTGNAKVLTPTNSLSTMVGPSPKLSSCSATEPPLPNLSASPSLDAKALHVPCVPSARHLVKQIEQHQRRSDELHRQAAHHIFAARNQGYDHETIDLAGLRAPEAAHHLVKRLEVCRKREVESLVILIPRLAAPSSSSSSSSTASSSSHLGSTQCPWSLAAIPQPSKKVSLSSDTTIADSVAGSGQTTTQQCGDGHSPTVLCAAQPLSSHAPSCPTSQNHQQQQQPFSHLIPVHSTALQVTRLSLGTDHYGGRHSCSTRSGSSTTLVRQTVLHLLHERGLVYDVNQPFPGAILVSLIP
ncbi:hypothetical protein H4R35_006870 [Dimargaris xerosporica]|nr:hypothetical protein H4R35_006870 [Dimargaris xerosporica]